VHAIDSAVVNLQVAPNPANTPVNLLVKSWTLPAGNEPLPLQNCTPAGSIPAQGQLSGPPITQNFQDHSIVYVPLFNVVVDPSYGLGPYFGANMLADYEDALLEATVTNINSALGTGDVRRNRVGVPDLIPSFGN
jgi:hypothetical protein